MRGSIGVQVNSSSDSQRFFPDQRRKKSEYALHFAITKEETWRLCSENRRNRIVLVLSVGCCLPRRRSCVRSGSLIGLLSVQTPVSVNKCRVLASHHVLRIIASLPALADHLVYASSVEYTSSAPFPKPRRLSRTEHRTPNTAQVQQFAHPPSHCPPDPRHSLAAATTLAAIASRVAVMRQSAYPAPKMHLPGSVVTNDNDSPRRATATSSPLDIVMPRPPSPSSSSAAAAGKDDKYEIKSGRLLLQHKLGERSMWLPVYVRVYRNAFEHFAVVSKDQAVSTSSTYVNLRASSAVPGDTLTHFRVVQNNYEGTVIHFDTSDKSSVSDWLEAFTCPTPPGSPTCGGVSPSLSPAIPRSPVMPTLPELDEEE